MSYVTIFAQLKSQIDGGNYGEWVTPHTFMSHVAYGWENESRHAH